jgi:AcrR family transcriptional regulator
MSELIAAAETSAGAFYGLFPSKDALVQALIEEAIDPVADAIDELASNEENPVTTLGLGLRTALAVAMRNTDWGHFVGQSTMLNYAFENGFRPRVTRDIRRAQREGRLPARDELVSVALMLGAFQAGVTLANQGFLTDRIVRELTERTLVAVGASAEVAAAVANRPLPPIIVRSEIDLN